MIINYDYNQPTPATVWTIEHNMGMYPCVMVRDLSDNVIQCDVKYDSNNQVTLTFNTPVAGRAVMS